MFGAVDNDFDARLRTRVRASECRDGFIGLVWCKNKCLARVIALTHVWKPLLVLGSPLDGLRWMKEGRDVVITW